MTKRFELTENHIKLLSKSFIEFNDSRYYGASSVNIIHPYGNSDVVGDIYEILYGEEWDYSERGEMGDELVNELMKIHRETATALQIVLCAKTFEPGLYEQKSEWSSLSWGKV